MRREAVGLKRQTTLIMRGLEEAAKEGLVEYHRNEQGEIDGITFKGQAHMGGSGSLHANPTVPNENDASADQE